MEIDFLIAKSKLTNRHNISPYIHDPVAVRSLHHQEVNLDIYSLMNPAAAHPVAGFFLREQQQIIYLGIDY